jgi:hypothetical protein
MFKEKFNDLKERVAIREVKKSVKQNPYVYGCASLSVLVVVLALKKPKAPTNVTIINSITPFSHNQ